MNWNTLFFILIVQAFLFASLARAESFAEPFLDDSQSFFEEEKVVAPAPIIDEATRQTYLDEAIRFYTTCRKDANYSKSYDCECIAGRLYDVRLESQEFFSRGDIVREALPDCKNTPKMANAHYEQCLTWSAAMRKNAKEFCECYGNSMARDFDRVGFVSAKHREGMMTYSMQECNKLHPSERQSAGKSKKQELQEKGLFDRLFPSFDDNE
ncbi:MAG: hypothetical protein ACPG05_00395 [Bdellovibrionales bacterium]